MPTPTFSILRMVPLVGAAAAIVGTLSLVNLVAVAAVGRYPESAWMHQWLDPFERARVAGIVATLDHAVEAKSALVNPTATGIVLGLSTAREGIEPLALRRRVQAVRWIANIAASGGSFQELLYYSEPVLRGDTKAKFILVGMHPAWLAGRRPLPPPAWAEVPTDPAQIGREFLQRIWLFENRLRIRNVTLNTLQDFRFQLLAFLGVHPAPATQLPPESLDATEHLYAGPRAPESFLAKQDRAFEQLGWFSAASYDHPDAELAALRDLLVNLRAVSPIIIVVLMPESSRFRSRVPQVAAERLRRSIADIPGTGLLDLQAALAESAFYDMVHPNAEGRRIIVDRIAAALPPEVLYSNGDHQ